MKRSIRRQMKEALSGFEAEDLAQRSAAACARLIALEEFRSASVIMIYLSLPTEVDTSPIALAAWQDDKTVLAPKVSWEHRHMLALEIHSLQSNLVIDERGLREPDYGHPWPVNDIDLIVVPGLAFDTRGNRLGRGMGFYDRFLGQPTLRALKCGLAFHEQVVANLPISENDVPIDVLATDRQVLRFDRRQAAL